MKKVIIIIILIFAINILNAQTLKSISNNKSLTLKNYNYLKNTDENLTIKNENVLNKKKGDFISLSSGFITTEDNTPFFGAFDMNINVRFISDIFYLNLGVCDIYHLSKNSNSFGPFITPGFGYHLIRNKIFTFAGFGFIVISSAICYNFILRINYNLSNNLSIGIDNRIIPLGKSNENYYTYIHSIGFNFSYKYNL